MARIPFPIDKSSLLLMRNGFLDSEGMTNFPCLFQSFFIISIHIKSAINKSWSLFDDRVVNCWSISSEAHLDRNEIQHFVLLEVLKKKRHGQIMPVAK